MAYDPDDAKLYVSDENGGTETVIDTKKNVRVATIRIGGDVGNTQYDASSHRILVNAQSRGDLVAIDPRSDTIVARYPIRGCASNHGLVLDSPHRRAYIACEGNAKLVVFDLKTLKQSNTFDVGVDPDVLAYDASTGRLYVATESGIDSIFAATASGLTKLGEAFVGIDAHIVAVDPRTHRLYFPVLDIAGPRMLVAEPR